jgi:hypothetical protein
MDTAYRVIWEKVHGVPFPAAEACHSCGNGHLGCVNWTHIDPGSHADNMADRRKDGRDPIGSAHPRSFLTEAQVVQMCELLTAGGSIRRVAEDFAVSEDVVSDIWLGKRWTHVQVPRLADLARTCADCGTDLPMLRQAGKRYCDYKCAVRASGKRRSERQRASGKRVRRS